ncbi:uncharacterized protein L199_001034 [Kwoniella botswanensis]|uniref:uncharacterized protein n=1 Tax=Kwoniella botswanensis TaxID=1268659 RepID=UPI00315DF94A
MGVITPIPNSKLPLTPPTTGMKALLHSITPSSLLSPTPNAIKPNAKAEDTDNWRNLPLILYHGSRQLSTGDAATETSSSQSIGQGGQKKEEALFFEKSVTPPREDTLMETVDTETDDEVVFVGNTVSVATTSRNASHAFTTSKLTHHHGELAFQHHQQVTLSGRSSRKRSEPEEEEEEEVSFIGRSYKTPRLEVRQHSTTGSREDTPLQTMPADGDSCSKCGSTCNDNSKYTRGKGTGRKVLTNKIRGNITALLMNPDQSLYDQLRSDPRVQDWKDIAQLVGAKREDYDRVRHAARWLQLHLPDTVAKGKL